MNNSTSHRIIPVVFIVLIVCLTFTMLQGYFPFIRRQWIFLVSISLVGLASAFSYCTTRQFACLMLYSIIVVINALLGDVFWNGSGQSIFELSLLLAPSIMTWYAFKEHDECFMKAVLIVFFTIVIFETIISYVANTQFPEIIRSLNSMKIEGLSSENAYYYYRLGVANYDIGHALPALIPLLVMGIKMSARNGKKRWLCLLLLAFSLLLIYLTFSTTSLILAIFGLLVAVFSKKGSLESNRTLIIISILFIPFLLSDTFLVGTMKSIDKFVDQEGSLHSKIVDMQESIQYGESTGDVSARGEKYDQSLGLFITSPLTGTNEKVGGHSSLMDRMATLGLIGFIPYILFLFYQLRFGKNTISSTYRIFYTESAMIGIVMLALKDADSWELFFTLFTLVPFLSYLLSNSSDYANKTVSNPI